MIDSFQDSLLGLYMINLLQSNDFALLKALQSEWQLVLSLVSVLDKTNAPKSTCTECRDKIEIVQVIVTSVLPFGSSSSILWRVIGWCFWII